jgi:outer membrane protein
MTATRDRRFRRGGLAALPALLLLLAFAPAPVGAQATPKLGVIDVERILTDSVRGKKALEELTKLRDQKNADLQSKRTEVEQLRNRFAESRLTLADDKLAEMERQLEDRSLELRRLQDDAQREVQKKQQEEFGRIESEVMPLIQSVGKESGFTLIFNKFQGGLIFADDSVDITDLVIQRFDAIGGG